MPVQKQYFRPLCRLAWYAILEQLLLTAVNYVDTAMVGSLGYLATAAVAVNITVVWMMNGITMGIASGYSVQAAHAIGAGDAARTRLIIRQALVAVLATGALLTALGLTLHRAIPRWLGAEASIIADAQAYLGIYMASMVFVIATAVFSSIHRCMGNTQFPLKVNIAANLLNVGFNFLLIFPTRTVSVGAISLCIPGAGWGVAGAAVATAIAMAFSGVVLAASFFLRQDQYRVELRDSFRPDGPVVRQAARLGIPLAAERMVMNSGQLIMTRLVASLGSISLAANQIAVTAEGLCYLPAHGIAHAATALVGQSIGAGSETDALRFGKVAVRCGCGLATVTAALLFAFAHPLCALFTASAETAALAARMLRIVAVSEPFLCSYLVASGALRGAANPRFPLLVGIVGMWVVRVPLSPLLMTAAGLGLTGVWLAMTADQVAKGLLCMIRIHRDGWIPAAALGGEEAATCSKPEA